MTRPTRAVADLATLRSNYLHARAVHEGRVAAVMKANAYGHRAARCTIALAHIADDIAVAFTQEAIHLRLCAVRALILVLEGAFDNGDLELASNHRLWMVHYIEQVKMLEQSGKVRTPIAVWPK